MIYGNWVRKQNLVKKDDWDYGKHWQSSRSFWTLKFELRTKEKRSVEDHDGESSNFKKNLRMSIKLWCDQMGGGVIQKRAID